MVRRSPPVPTGICPVNCLVVRHRFPLNELNHACVISSVVPPDYGEGIILVNSSQRSDPAKRTEEVCGKPVGKPIGSKGTCD